MSDLTKLSLTELSNGLQTGAFSSRELTQAYLDRIDRFEPHLHAFITLTPELALKAANQADQSLAD